MADLVTIFCEVDDFCKDFEKNFNKFVLSDGKNIRKRSMRMQLSEVMTILIYSHYARYATFKDYYTKHVENYMNSDFRLVSYNRFIELRKIAMIPLLIFLRTRKMGTCTGISYIDSFPLKACNVRRASSHKTLQSVAAKGKTSTGWFYGMKLHVTINHQGECISFAISKGNTSDSNNGIICSLTKKIIGKLIGDRGYILREEIRKMLAEQDIQVITKVRKNMKVLPITFGDRELLRQRGVIESVGNILKNILGIEHTRHRSVEGFFTNIFSALVAYQMREKKPSITRNFFPYSITA